MEDVQLPLEYMDRQGRLDYVDINQYIGMTYASTHVGVATWLSQNTDLPLIYFLLCPFALYSGYQQGYEFIDLDDEISELDELHSLMLGSSTDTVDEILIHINKMNARLTDQAIINKLNLAGIILQKLSNPYKNGDIRHALIKISDAIELLGS
jgi:hypothetical protein